MTTSGLGFQNNGINHIDCPSGGGPVTRVITALRAERASVCRYYDWSTGRTVPEFIDGPALADALRSFGRAACLEIGHGSCAAAKWRADSAGASTVAIGAHRLLFDLPSIVRLFLDAAGADAASPAWAVREAADAISGELLAPPFGPCPRPGDLPDDDGADLAEHVARCLADYPDEILPHGDEMAVADRRGEITYRPMRAATLCLLGAILRRDLRADYGQSADALADLVHERACAAEVRVGKFDEIGKLLRDGETFHHVFDLRALAHDPRRAMGNLASLARRLRRSGLLISDACCSAYDWEIDRHGIAAAARETAGNDISWWLVLDGGAPVGLVAMKGTGTVPRRLLRPGYYTCRIDVSGDWLKAVCDA